MENLDEQNLKSYTRPVVVNYCQEEGLVAGQITSASIEERNSIYSNSGKRQVLFLRIIAYSKKGEVVLTYMVTYSWSQKSKMFGLLKNLELLPAPGDNLYLESFEGIMVNLVVENIQKDDRIYTNIISIKNRDIDNN